MSVNFDAQSLADAKNDNQLVLVDFWAEWCGPCRMLSPLVDGIAKEYEGKVTVGKVDLEENSDLAVEYSVASIPRLLLFRGDKIIWDRTGAVPAPTIKKALDSALQGEI